MRGFFNAFDKMQNELLSHISMGLGVRVGVKMQSSTQI